MLSVIVLLFSRKEPKEEEMDADFTYKTNCCGKITHKNPLKQHVPVGL